MPCGSVAATDQHEASMGVVDTGWIWLLAFAATVAVYLVWIGMLQLGIALAPLPLSVAVIWLVVFIMPVLLASALADLVLMGGLGMFVWEAHSYFKLGYWPWRSGLEVLSLLNVREIPTTGWASFDRAAITVLSWPILLTTTVPGLYGVGAALVAYRVYCWWSDAADKPAARV